jgi:isopentenyl-diphosphate delta-isomerase
MQRDPSCAHTYQVRDVAPDILLFANLGVVQARETQSTELQSLIEAVGADAICLHMNPAMELVQPEGDRDFRGGTETIQRCVEELGVPVIAKETGNGISRQTAEKLKGCGVEYVDVSGAGGTSWVGVETLRAEGDQKALGELFWDWGVPTAASIAHVEAVGLQPIATGGIRHGLDIARAISLGARAGGIARGVFQAFEQGAEQGAEAFLDRVEAQLRATMLLVGAANVSELRTAPRIVQGELRDWLKSPSY